MCEIEADIERWWGWQKNYFFSKKKKKELKFLIRYKDREILFE